MTIELYNNAMLTLPNQLSSLKNLTLKTDSELTVTIPAVLDSVSELHLTAPSIHIPEVPQTLAMLKVRANKFSYGRCGDILNIPVEDVCVSEDPL